MSFYTPEMLEQYQKIYSAAWSVILEALLDEKIRKEVKEDLARQVIGLQKKHRTSRFLKLRFEVLKRDNFTCVYCGRSSMDGIKLHVDHVKPKSQGGKDTYDNLVAACFECNIGKNDCLLEARHEQKFGDKCKQP